MPAPAAIAGMVVVGIATAVALEVTVFRPWRNQHWEEFASDANGQWNKFRETFHDTSEDIQKRGKKAWNDVTGRDRVDEARSYEETLREIEEFELSLRRGKKAESSQGTSSYEGSVGDTLGRQTIGQSTQVAEANSFRSTTLRHRNHDDHATTSPAPHSKSSSGVLTSLLDEQDVGPHDLFGSSDEAEVRTISDDVTHGSDASNISELSPVLQGSRAHVTAPTGNVNDQQEAQHPGMHRSQSPLSDGGFSQYTEAALSSDADWERLSDSPSSRPSSPTLLG